MKELKVITLPNQCIHILINRPKSLNSIKSEMFPTIEKLLLQNTKAHFIIISGVGRAFCAGGDLIQITDFVQNNVSEAESLNL